MTIRSMPPASSHLAEMPVPAPPPTMGRPAATLARRRWRIADRLVSTGMVFVRTSSTRRQQVLHLLAPRAQSQRFEILDHRHSLRVAQFIAERVPAVAAAAL